MWAGYEIQSPTQTVPKNMDTYSMFLGTAARQVARDLDRLSSYSDMTVGAKLSTGGILKIISDHDKVIVPLVSDADSIVIGTALKLNREVGNVMLLTTDGNMRTATRKRGCSAECYPFEESHDLTIEEWGISENTIPETVEDDRAKKDGNKNFSDILKGIVIVVGFLMVGVAGYVTAKLGSIGATIAVIVCGVGVGLIAIRIYRLVLAKIHEKRWKKMRDEIMAEDPWL
jgi:predicted ribonuclease YlaK